MALFLTPHLHGFHWPGKSRNCKVQEFQENSENFTWGQGKYWTFYCQNKDTIVCCSILTHEIISWFLAMEKSEKLFYKRVKILIWQTCHSSFINSKYYVHFLIFFHTEWYILITELVIVFFYSKFNLIESGLQSTSLNSYFSSGCLS